MKDLLLIVVLGGFALACAVGLTAILFSLSAIVKAILPFLTGG